MWILLILTLTIMSVLTIIQTPREWLKMRVPRILLIIFHTVGMISIILILFGVYRMKDGWLRDAVVWTETFYVNLVMYALLLSAVRYFGFELARHFRHGKVIRILGSHTVFFVVAFLVSVTYMIPAVYNATNLRTVTYDIQVDKKCDSDKLSVAVISDFHLGAGARHQEMDQMAELLEEAKPELILIAGDVCDSSSSVYDLEYMETVLKKLDCRYGIFYAEGNHERECRIDPKPYLQGAGVTILEDKGLRLENGVNIIGRKNELKTSATQIMEECGLDPDDPTIIFQHRPKGLKGLEGKADLVACGHTHGYSYPFVGIMMPYVQDVSYGQRTYGETKAIVTSGVAEWGFRTKWPSRSEVTMINMNFNEVKE